MKLYQMILIVSGRVQGVFFREFVCEEANRLGLVGSVQNNPDGAVGIIVEGKKSKLEELKAWCQKGPKYARVEKVGEEWKEIEKLSFGGFRIV